MGKVQPVLVLAGRIVLGLMLALVLSVLGLGVAWGLYVFSGARSFGALFFLFMLGAGIGAGAGGFLAWLRIDRTTRASLVLMGLLALAAGIGGAWGGYGYGSRQEVECCARPDIGPMTYAAIGATVVANSSLMVFGLVRDALAGRRQTHIHYPVT